MNPGGTVLLVDDDPGLRRALARLLRTEGFTLAAFASAEEFLHAPPPPPPACVILDVSLPGLDGLAVQRRLAEDGTPLPVVFLTGHGDISMSVRAI
ncbi:MAG TPA: response regulator, partial [Verrucomicrobiota bacterium]|nr:response regulator [Verrucomicrobiota bacterium]